MNRKSLRRRAMHWLWRHQEGWPDRLLDNGVFNWATDRFADLGCWFAGHDPVPDQCGIPEHDFCAWCMRLLPGQAHKERTG